MKTEIVQRIWEGQMCVVAASGPGLSQDVADRCKGIRTIAVQDAWRRMPWSDALFGTDTGWWQVHDGARGFNGAKWSSHDDGGNDKTWVAREYGVRLVAGKKADGFSLNPAVLHYGDNSTHAAVNLAILFGSPRIILVGANMQAVGGNTHYFGRRPADGRLRACTDYRRFVRNFEKAAEMLPPHITIINATPNSALRCFPMMDLLCLWGTRKKFAIDAQKQAGGEVVVLERGYLLDRFAWTSVSRGGGLNNRGIFRGPFHDGSRWERHFSHLMKAWATSSTGYALIIGQVAGDMSLRGMDLQPWYRATAYSLRTRGFDVRFRPHPVAVERSQALPVDGAPTISGTLQDALAGAAFAVTWNSNTGVESVLAGVPTITCDKGAMAWPVTSHELGTAPPTPDRTSWAHKLSWCQWTIDEIQSGSCWAAVGIDQ